MTNAEYLKGLATAFLRDGERAAGCVDCDRLIAAADEIERLQGTMRYIAAQAKAKHHGALTVIQSNAEAALAGPSAAQLAAVNR